MIDDPEKDQESNLSEFEVKEEDVIEVESVETEVPIVSSGVDGEFQEREMNEPLYNEAEMVEDIEDIEEPSYVEDEDIYAYADEVEGDDLSSLDDDGLFDESSYGFDPQNKSNTGTIAIVILLFLLGGGGFYFLSSDTLFSSENKQPVESVSTQTQIEDQNIQNEGDDVALFLEEPIESETKEPFVVEETFGISQDDKGEANLLDEGQPIENVSTAELFKLPQPVIDDIEFNFDNVVEVVDASVPEQVDLKEPAVQKTVPQNQNDDELIVEVINTPAEVAEFFDADTGDSYSSLSTFKRQGEVIADPRRKQMAQFVVVENVVKTDAHNNELIMAQRALNLGRYEAALGFYENLYKKNKRDPRILIGRAVALQKTGRPAEALKAYEETLDIYPSNSEALVNYLGLMNAQYPQNALQKLQILHQSKPNNPAVAAQLGIAYGNTGDFKNAQTFLRMASSMEPENALHFYNLAIISERAGDRSSAVSAYEKALEVDAIYGGRTISRETVYDRLSVLR